MTKGHRAHSAALRRPHPGSFLILAGLVAGSLGTGCGGEKGSAEGSGGPSSLPELSEEVLQDLGGKLQGTFAAVQQGNPQQAIEYLTLALEKAPDGAVLHYHLAVAYGAMQQPQEALAHLEQAADLGLRDARMIDREETLAETRELPGWPPLRQRMMEASSRSRPVNLVTYQRLDPDGEADFATLDELLAHYQAPLRRLTLLMMIYPSDLVFPEIWSVLNHKMAALEKYGQKENLDPGEALRIDHEFLQTAGAYESQNRTPWMQSTVKLIEEKTNAFIERHPEEPRAGAQALYLQARAKWFGMLPAEQSAVDASARQAAIDLHRQVDEHFPGTTGALLALLDALDLTAEEGGLRNSDLVPLVDRVREGYADNGMLQRLSYRFQPYVLGAYGLPEFTAVDLDGREWNSADLTAKATLIDFWATWCAPCRRELPNLTRVYDQYREQGFEILGISVDDPAKTTPENLRAWAGENGLDWPLIYDQKYWDSPIVRACGVSGIPFPILVDANGRVIAAGQEATGSRLREALREIFS